MLNVIDIACASFEMCRAAANDDRAAHRIRADVTLSGDAAVYEFPAIGPSIKAIAESGEKLSGKLFGEAPFGQTVIEVPQ